MKYMELKVFLSAALSVFSGFIRGKILWRSRRRAVGAIQFLSSFGWYTTAMFRGFACGDLLFHIDLACLSGSPVVFA